MSRKAKYTIEQKIQAAERYIRGEARASVIAAEMRMTSNGSRQIHEWAAIYRENGVEGRNDNSLVFSTFDRAIEANPEAKPLFHSDRGFQYTSKVFQNKLTNQGMTQSMSRVGHCIDNGPTEGFWGIVKAEMYNLRKFSSEEELSSAIEEFISILQRGQIPGALRI